MIKFFYKTLMLSLLSLSSFSLFAQERLPDSCLVNFYPLNIGDTWQYKLMGPLEILITRTVIGDTLFGNGKSYKVIEGFAEGYNAYFYAYQRYDSSAVYGYVFKPEREVLIYKFDENVGEYWDTNRPSFCEPDSAQLGRLDYILENEIFGEVRIEVSISSFCLPDTVYWLSDRIVKGIGPIKFGGEGDYEVLQGAIINGKQYGVITSIAGDDSPLPNVTELLSNYPNPFNSSTNIRYGIKTAQEIEIAVYDILGRRVSVLYSGFRMPGVYFTDWDGTDSKGKPVASGSYVIFSKGQHFVKSRFITLLK